MHTQCIKKQCEKKKAGHAKVKMLPLKQKKKKKSYEWCIVLWEIWPANYLAGQMVKTQYSATEGQNIHHHHAHDQYNHCQAQGSPLVNTEQIKGWISINKLLSIFMT